VAIASWDASGRKTPVATAIQEAIDAVAAGLPLPEDR
jgi:hypothetical protein